MRVRSAKSRFSVQSERPVRQFTSSGIRRPDDQRRRHRLPNGQKHRERSKAPVSSRTGALRWGEKRERHIDDYAIANRQKPSGIAAKRTILNLHLGRRKSGEAPDVHSVLRVARARDGAEGRSLAIRADDRTARRGAPRPPASEECLGLDDGSPLTQDVVGD